MIETKLLDLVESYLHAQAGIGGTVSTVEPAGVGDAPAVVLSLIRAKRPGNGLGERSTVITGGALPVTATIDLANPVLATDPAFRLLSADGLQLTLPHGGLVRSDGSDGALGPADLTVSVAGTARPVVTGTPVNNQVTADRLAGVLTFATALPAAGEVTANYFLGRWEQRTQQMTGILRVSVKAADAATVLSLSNAVLNAFDAQTVAGLGGVQVVRLAPVRPAAPNTTNLWSRVALLSFQFELLVNQPESSGGIIQRIPVNASVM